MPTLSSKNKKKLLSSVFAVIILSALVWMIVFVLLFIKKELLQAVGDFESEGYTDVRFNFQKADTLGIVVE